jgi:hypothetical protein
LNFSGSIYVIDLPPLLPQNHVFCRAPSMVYQPCSAITGGVPPQMRQALWAGTLDD